jgi:hypothetical protein
MNSPIWDDGPGQDGIQIVLYSYFKWTASSEDGGSRCKALRRKRLIAGTRVQLQVEVGRRVHVTDTPESSLHSIIRLSMIIMILFFAYWKPVIGVILRKRAASPQALLLNNGRSKLITTLRLSGLDYLSILLPAGLFR